MTALFYCAPAPGYLRVAGKDRVDFLQRQTTNDARALAPDRALLTVLTTGTARIIDVWRLVMDAEDSIGIVTLPGRAAATAQYLQSRIFFMDKVTVTDASAEISLVEVFGPSAESALRAVGLESAPRPGQVIGVDSTLRAVGLNGLIGQGTLLLTAADRASALIAILRENARELGADAYNVWRVETGLPGPSRELTQDFTPLEANLDAAINDTKGCYAGQEIIARQVTYDKITKRLVGLRLDMPVPVGAAVTVEGRTAGEVTSAVESPRFGPIALAVIKRPHFEPGTAVTAGESVRAITAALPFEN